MTKPDVFGYSDAQRLRKFYIERRFHIQRVGGWWVMTPYRGSRCALHGRRTVRELCEDVKRWNA